MEILIVRHGQAVDDAPGLGDSGRWLTARGREVSRRVARWLAKRKDRRPAAIWTSPLVRAVQTAEILAEAAGLSADVSVAPELSPGRDPVELMRLLSHHRGPEPLALVGHEPLLSSLVSSLLGDAVWSGVMLAEGGEPRPKLRKSGVAALCWDRRGAAELRFVLDPKEMTVVGRAG
ncbi:MAG TPA: phosphohistidine phosphatase SixA [Candidatus Nanopelagicales bacterium]|nr:phosphohistidine phosphatase SixA [Candidatus Nanopelagicales bacterium]